MITVIYIIDLFKSPSQMLNQSTTSIKNGPFVVAHDRFMRVKGGAADSKADSDDHLYTGLQKKGSSIC